MPVMAPPRNATASAAFMPSYAACAVRELLRALHDMYLRGTRDFGGRLVPLLALAGLAIGLAAGSKASGPLYAGVAILVVAVNVLVLHRSRGLSGRLAAASFLVILAPVLEGRAEDLRNRRDLIEVSYLGEAALASDS